MWYAERTPGWRVAAAGFSMVEVLIVVTCIAIVAMLVLPGGGPSEAGRVEQAARLLVADLEYAQLQSLGNGADPAEVVFDVAEQAYHVGRQFESGEPLIETRFGEGRAHGLADVTIVAVEAGEDNAIRFTAMGALTTGADATVMLQCGSHSLTIRVEAATGQPIVE